MGTISKSYTFTNGATILAEEHNQNFDVLYNWANGNITNANIKSGAAIAMSKLDLTGDVTFSGDLEFSGDVEFSNQVTFSDDVVLGTPNQGDILYDDGTKLTRLTPGTDGQVLTTKGAAANPEWAEVVASPFTAGGAYSSKVLLALRFNSVDGSTFIHDNSPYGLYCNDNFLCVNNCVIDDAQKPFDDTSLLLPADTSYISWTAPQNIVRLRNITTFSLCFHVRFAARAYSWIIDWGYLTTDGISLFQDNDANNTVQYRVGNTTYDTGWNPSTNTWYHVELSRDSSNDVRMFVDGTQVGATQASANVVDISDMAVRYIGTYSGGTDTDMNGWLKDLVLTTECLHTANFTAPATYLTDATGAYMKGENNEYYVVGG
jgi:hypothetical protein